MSKRFGTAVLLAGSFSALVGCTAILGSFDVSTAADDGGTGDENSSVPPPGTPPPPPPGGDAGGDAAPACNAPAVACGDHCSVLATSDIDCGKCGHSCGGGTCANSVCQVATAVDTSGGDAGGGPPIGPMAVGDVELFFAVNDQVGIQNKLLACPKAGCKAPGPRQLAVMQYSINAVNFGAKGTVSFLSAPAQSTERPSVYACPVAGCASPPTYFVMDGLNGFEQRLRSTDTRVFAHGGGVGIISGSCNAGACTNNGSPSQANTKSSSLFTPDGTDVYFLQSATSFIVKCAQTDTACTPTTVDGVAQANMSAMETFGGKLYWFLKGRDGFTEGKLWTCDLPACTTPKVIANGLDSPANLVVDASGFYWTTSTGANVPDRLQRCAPGACIGGPQDVFPSALPGIHDLATDPDFIYWVQGSKILRLAKPLP